MTIALSQARNLLRRNNLSSDLKSKKKKKKKKRGSKKQEKKVRATISGVVHDVLNNRHNTVRK